MTENDIDCCAFEIGWKALRHDDGGARFAGHRLGILSDGDMGCAESMTPTSGALRPRRPRA